MASQKRGTLPSGIDAVVAGGRPKGDALGQFIYDKAEKLVDDRDKGFMVNQSFGEICRLLLEQRFAGIVSEGSGTHYLLLAKDLKAGSVQAAICCDPKKEEIAKLARLMQTKSPNVIDQGMRRFFEEYSLSKMTLLPEGPDRTKVKRGWH